jgi:hypothetical protein
MYVWKHTHPKHMSSNLICIETIYYKLFLFITTAPLFITMR